MKLTRSEYNTLSYLLKTNVISHKRAIEWAYSQYSGNVVDPFIEKISLAFDVAEILELIGSEFQVFGEPEPDFIVGEIANQYSLDQISLYKAITEILYRVDFDMSQEEKTNLYIADDYFGWHDHAEKKALPLVLPIFSKYKLIYEDAVQKLGV